MNLKLNFGFSFLCCFSTFLASFFKLIKFSCIFFHYYYYYLLIKSEAKEDKDSSSYRLVHILVLSVSLDRMVP